MKLAIRSHFGSGPWLVDRLPIMRTLPVLFAFASVGEAGKHKGGDKMASVKQQLTYRVPCDTQCQEKTRTSDLVTRYLSLGRKTITGSMFDDLGVSCSWDMKTYWSKLSGKRVGKCPIEAIVPSVKGDRDMGIDWPLVGHTMVGHRRLENIEGSLRSVISSQIEGHFVELGVWKGGASIYARMVLNVLEQRNRTAFVLDAFETLKGYDKAQ